jgi:hypothetical protein
MELEEGQRGHFGILGLQSSISHGFWKVGGSLLRVKENPAPAVKTGNSTRIEINTLKALLDIKFTITYGFWNCQSK